MHKVWTCLFTQKKEEGMHSVESEPFILSLNDQWVQRVHSHSADIKEFIGFTLSPCVNYDCNLFYHLLLSAVLG